MHPIRTEFNCLTSIALLKLCTLRLDSQVTWSPSTNPIGLHKTRLVHLHRVIKRSTNSGHRPLTPHCTCQLINYKFTTNEITTTKQDSHCLQKCPMIHSVENRSWSHEKIVIRDWFFTLESFTAEPWFLWNQGPFCLDLSGHFTVLLNNLSTCFGLQVTNWSLVLRKTCCLALPEL